MTSDVREIKNKYIDSEVSTISSNNRMFKDGDIVIEVKTGKKMEIRKYDPKIDRYICYSDKGIFEGSFSGSDLRKNLN